MPIWDRKCQLQKAYEKQLKKLNNFEAINYCGGRKAARPPMRSPVRNPKRKRRPDSPPPMFDISPDFAGNRCYPNRSIQPDEISLLVEQPYEDWKQVPESPPPCGPSPQACAGTPEFQPVYGDYSTPKWQSPIDALDNVLASPPPPEKPVAAIPINKVMKNLDRLEYTEAETIQRDLRNFQTCRRRLFFHIVNISNECSSDSMYAYDMSLERYNILEQNIWEPYKSPRKNLMDVFKR